MPTAESASRLSDSLAGLGMNQATATVYVALLGLGESSAISVSRSTGIHRVDVYKRLKELVRLGFANVRLGRPSLYSATDPTSVLDTITEAKKAELSSMMNRKDKLVRDFADFVREAPRVEPTEPGQVYRLIVGRQKGYEEAKRLVASAQSEILRVVSSNGLVRNFKFNVMDEYRNCALRGVKIRIISDFDHVPRRIVRFCGANFEVRHASESSMRLLIVDRRSMLFSAVFNDSEMTMNSFADRYLLIRDEKIADVMALLFENLWNSSMPLRGSL